MKKVIVSMGIFAAIMTLGVQVSAQTEEIKYEQTAEVIAQTADISAENITADEDYEKIADTPSPATGVEGIALVAGTAITAGGIVLVATKKK